LEVVSVLHEEVVVPLDGSAFAERALAPALSLARRDGSPVTLVAVARPDADVEEHKRYLHEVANRHGRAVHDIRVILGQDAALGILRVAHERPGALICMGSHGRTGLREALLGSVAGNVVRTATRPLLLVGQNCREGELGFERLLVPIDGSVASEAVLPEAVAWVQTFGLALCLVQVIETAASSVVGPDVQEDSYLRRQAHELADKGIQAEWDVLHGRDAARAIVDYAASGNVSLLALGTHGRGGWARLAIGSTAAQIVHDSPRPVLVLGPPHLGREGGEPAG
jgi:nucleotide-binding universal stress UspA family protein